MEKQQIKNVVVTVSLVAMIFSGCAGEKKVAPPPQKTSVMNKPAPVPVAPSGVKLRDLQSQGIAMGITLKGNPNYSENEPVRFIVDTGKNEGYLYIIYLDNNGNTGLLYPNANSPLSEMGGKYLFPNDFGNMNIRATKDCKNCEKEKTSVYALLSKEPILDIKNISKSELLSFFGESSAQSKGLSMDLGGAGSSAQVSVGKLDFFVE